jgi:uncharacterized integral membrane protein
VVTTEDGLPVPALGLVLTWTIATNLERRGPVSFVRSSIASAFLVLRVILIALVIANTRRVELSWIVDMSHASLEWITVVAAIAIAVAIGVVLCVRTRRQPSA